MSRAILRRTLVTIAAIVTIAAPVAEAQETQARPDVLASLLVEVRALRESLEQLAAAGPRVQLAMGRLQIQEQRLTAARRRLDDLREAIANGDRELADLRERLALGEDAVSRVDAAEREAMTAQMKMVKSALAQRAADVQRLREQEAEQAGTVAAEESRWTEFSQRLDELERALNPRR